MIGPFQGKYRWLNNFAPAYVTLDGLVYPTVEHAYQAAKTLSIRSQSDIRAASTPGKAKKLGRMVTMRIDWNSIKLDVMLRLTREKYQQPEYRKLLSITGAEHIEEINTWGDTYWGTCGGEGHNHLGEIIMRVRSELRS